MNRIPMLRMLRILLISLIAPALATTAGEAPAKKMPNLVVDASGNFINAIVQRRIDQVDTVEEVVLDTPTEARARSIGTVRAELVPNAQAGIVDVVLATRVYSRAIATRPHVLIHTTSVSDIDVRRRVVIDGNGIQAFPGPICAESTINLLDVCSRQEPDYQAMRANRIGFERNLAEAQWETSSKAGKRTAGNFAAELTPPLAYASKSISSGISLLAKAGLPLEAMSYSTTSTMLQGQLRFSTFEKASAPPRLGDDVDMAIRVHQSLFNDAAQRILTGKAFRLNEVEGVYQDITGGMLLDARKKEDRESALALLAKLVTDAGGKLTTITFAEKAPVLIQFADSGFSIEAHLGSVRVDKTTYRGMRVKAQYDLKNSADGELLIRKGPIQFLPSDDKTSPEQPASMLLLRTAIFGEVMKERLLLKTPMPTALAKVQLEPARVDARNGWLVLAWQLKSRAVVR